MLEILYQLGPFFEDSYRSISVREYAKLVRVSPPTASKLLKELAKEGYLQQREERKHLLFTLQSDNEEVVDLCKLYWKKKLQKLIREFLTGQSLSAKSWKKIIHWGSSWPCSGSRRNFQITLPNS